MHQNDENVGVSASEVNQNSTDSSSMFGDLSKMKRNLPTPEFHTFERSEYFHPKIPPLSLRPGGPGLTSARLPSERIESGSKGSRGSPPCSRCGSGPSPASPRGPQPKKDLTNN